MLTVLERSAPVVKPSGQKEKAYKCRCDCGNVVVASAWSIETGDRKSCGCQKRPERIVGEKYGRLTVAKRVEDKYFPGGSHQPQFECVCDCGNIVVTTAAHLRSGHTKSCGCYASSTISERNTTHGDSSSRLYWVWSNMKRRCDNQNSRDYKTYGGRGIRVCDEWNDYAKFQEWALNNGYSASAKRGDCTIDRINVDGDYCPDNCRWISIADQEVNRTNNRRITIDGVTKVLSDWCRFYDIKPNTVQSRLRRGWSEIDALTIKPNSSKKESCE